MYETLTPNLILWDGCHCFTAVPRQRYSIMPLTDCYVLQGMKKRKGKKRKKETVNMVRKLDSLLKATDYITDTARGL